MDLTFNLQNSPYFLGSLFILLLLILLLRSPSKKILKYLIKKIKNFKIKKKNKVKKEVVKVVKIVKVESVKKEVRGYWEKTLFLIIGIGVIIISYFKNWDILISKYELFYNFVLSGTNHRNLTTIIVTVIISIVLLWIIKLMAILRKKRTTVMKGIHYVIFSVITVVSFLIITKSVMASNLSLINSIIMGIVFIAFGIFIKRKK